MDVGGAVDAAELLKSYDAIVLCCGAKKARDLNVPGRDAPGASHLAVDYLTSVTKSLLDSSFADGKAISAAGKNVSSSAAATPATTVRARPCGRAAPT